MKSFLFLALLASGCGFSGTEAIKTNDATQTVAINFGFLDQLTTLCKQENLPELYASTELYNQAVATCVFQNMTIVNAAQLTQLQNQTCKPGADLSQYTPSQITQLQSTCKLLGYTP
jgi:hypothetical protein